MNELNKTKFQVTVNKQPKGLWSFGVCISRFHDEIYIFLNLFKISVSVGKLYVEAESDNDDGGEEQNRKAMQNER